MGGTEVVWCKETSVSTKHSPSGIYNMGGTEVVGVKKQLYLPNTLQVGSIIWVELKL